MTPGDVLYLVLVIGVIWWAYAQLKELM